MLPKLKKCSNFPPVFENLKHVFENLVGIHTFFCLFALFFLFCFILLLFWFSDSSLSFSALLLLNRGGKIFITTGSQNNNRFAIRALFHLMLFCPFMLLVLVKLSCV